MERHYDIWNIFHDGGIEQIIGSVPGTIRIRVGIEYIRHIFSGDGNSIWIELIECSKFQYEPWDESPTIKEIFKIEKMEPEILSADVRQDGDLLIICTDGNIRARYKGAAYELDNGKKVTFEDLDRASETYWNNWKKNKT